MKRYQMYINGEFVESKAQSWFPVYDPSTEEVIAGGAGRRRGRCGSRGKAARAAFDSGPWAQTTAQDRGRMLFRLAAKIRQESAALADSSRVQQRQAHRRGGI